MSLYLSKKITMKEAEGLRCLSMNKRDGYIGVGGMHGFLKVFKLDHEEGSGLEGRQLVTANSLLKEQILKGHKASIECIEWNEKFRKMMSGDAEGKIIVWINVQNQWYEEMCNHGNQSSVSSVRWSPDDFKICIAYKDGEVMVGSVDGKRSWASNLKKKISCVEWSADSRLIVLGVGSTEVHLYDCHGLFLKKLIDFKNSPHISSHSLLISPSHKSSSSSSSSSSKSLIIDWLRVDQEWHKGASLVVAHEGGLCYLMAGEADEVPRVLETKLKRILWCKWASDGSYVGVLGVGEEEEFGKGAEKRESDGGGGGGSGERFYLKLFRSDSGEMEHSLLLPEGMHASCFCFDRGAVRLLIAIGVYVYFANHRLNYKWCSLNDSIVFNFHKTHTLQSYVVFWNVKRHEMVMKPIENVVSIVGCEQFCCIITRDTDTDDDVVSTTNIKLGNSSDRPGYYLLLTNSIAAHFDSKHVEMPLQHYGMSASHVVVASSSAFYVWQFKNFKGFANLERGAKKKGGLEKLLHIDDVASGVGGENIDWLRTATPTEDEIGRSSGLVHLYRLPNLLLEHKLRFGGHPAILKLNSDASCLAFISSNEELTFVSMEKPKNSSNNNNDNNNKINNNSINGNDLSNKNNNYQQDFNNSVKHNGGVDNDDDETRMVKIAGLKVKATWMLVWAKDDPTSFALLSNTKTQTYKNFQLEDIFVSSGYLSSFSDLQVTLILLDDLYDLLCHSSNPPSKSSLADLVYTHQLKSLRQIKETLRTDGYEAAHKFAVDNHHPMLWKLLAEHSLSTLNLQAAEDCYARAQNLCGIRFTRRLRNLQNDGLKKAEVEVFFGRFDEAEKVYLSMDRKDLAMAMRTRIGDYGKEVALVVGGGGGWMADVDKRESYNRLGDHYYDLQMWTDAVVCYREAGNDAQLLHCHLNTEDFPQLFAMLASLPHNHTLLPELGKTLAMMGLCEEAVKAYLKCDKIQEALDTCVRLNHWNLAIEIGHAHNRKEVDAQLLRYMDGVKDRPFESVELYRKANHHMKAAHILFTMAEDLRKGSSKGFPKVSAPRMKQLYLLCCLLLEEHQVRCKENVKRRGDKKTDEATLVLEGLLKDDESSNSRMVGMAWRCAEAYHFYVLALCQFYQGDYESSMLTSLHLKDFDDVINPFDIYSIMALSSLACNLYCVCSKAFMRLEALQDLTEGERTALSELAVAIFYKNNSQKQELPVMKCVSCAEMIPYTCTTCPSCDSKLVVCIASGRVITKSNAWYCSSCKRCAYEHVISAHAACPFCMQDTVKYAGGKGGGGRDDDDGDDSY